MNSNGIALIAIKPEALLQRQVKEAYRYAPGTVVFGFVCALMTLIVFTQANDVGPALFWFALATAVFLFRTWTVWQFHQTAQPLESCGFWVRMLLWGNVLLGVQWGLLGTLLLNQADVHRELYVLVLIMLFVAASVTPFASLKWAHSTLAIPAALPTVIYVFFLQSGLHWLPGSMALVCVMAILFLAHRQHDLVTKRLKFELQYEALLERLNMSNSQLGQQNSELKHRTEVVKRAQLEARRRAAILSAHVERTLLPVIECDSDFAVVTWNEAATQVFGYSADEARGANLGELVFPPERRANIVPFVERTFRDDRPTTVDLYAVTRAGQSIPVKLYVTPVLGEDRSPLRLAIIVAEAYSDAEDYQSYRKSATSI